MARCSVSGDECTSNNTMEILRVSYQDFFLTSRRSAGLMSGVWGCWIGLVPKLPCIFLVFFRSDSLRTELRQSIATTDSIRSYNVLQVGARRASNSLLRAVEVVRGMIMIGKHNFGTILTTHAVRPFVRPSLHLTASPHYS